MSSYSASGNPDLKMTVAAKKLVTSLLVYFFGDQFIVKAVAEC
jgi:hypothetical protein